MLDEKRVRRVFGEMEERGLTQMMVSDPNAIFWLTGKWIFPGERFLGLLLRLNRPAVLYVNILFQFEEEIGAEKVYFSDTDDIVPLWKNEIDPQQKLGIDKVMPSKFLLMMMENNVAAGYTGGSIAIDLTRQVKDEREQELMRRSSRINDAAMERFVKLVVPGVSEIEIAEQLLPIYKSLGAQKYSFDPIVSFGAHAADPHHMPDGTVLQEGDCVLFDVGCVADNYCSDMTRTFFYKREPSERDRLVYETVLKANRTAEQMLRPGIVLSTVDKTARDIIEAEGFGPYFTHRLGHFIGIEDHEYGDVSLANQSVTRAGNTHSIEPGIYLPGEMGVRIEDLVLITQNGHEVLNSYPKDLEVIG